MLTQEENFSQSRIFSRFISTENYDLIFVLLLMFVANMLTVTSTSNYTAMLDFQKQCNLGEVQIRMRVSLV